MSTQVTVTLPDDTYRRAEYLAQLTGRDIADVLAETIQISLQPLGEQRIDPPGALSDEEVLAVATSHMDAIQDRQLAFLLEEQQARSLTGEEHALLAALLQVYQDGLLRKARALHEAVQRRLLPPLAP